MGKKDFCCANGCSHDRSKGASCSFYSIPSEPTLRSAWLLKISRVERVVQNGRVVTQAWKPSKSSKLCSCHFDIAPPTKSRKRSFLVPTIFSHRPTSEKKSRRPLRERNFLNQSNNGDQPIYSISDDVTDEVTDEVTDDRDGILADEDVIPNVVLAEPASEEYKIDNPADHDYICTATDKASYSIVADNPDLLDIIKSQSDLQKDRAELSSLKESGRVLSLSNLIQDPKLFYYYTGLKTDVFNALYKYLESKAKVLKYPYGARTVLFKHHADVNKKKPGKSRSHSLEEEMFFTLVKLKLGLQNVDCAIRFGMSASTFSSIFTAWVTLLSQELEKICKMPPTTETDSVDSASCFEEFPNVKIIIDCTELFAETPSSVGVHKQFHSSYKHHSTVKFLVGMNTGGAITYISDMYGGRASDKFITNESGDLLDNLNAGEKVMADRGFTIQDDLPAGVKLVIPSFKHKDKSQFTKVELMSNKKISEARVHIERAIRRVKQFQILKCEMKLTQVDIYSNIFKACGYLVNFQDPFLKV